jgi:hypothetical protein
MLLDIDNLDGILTDGDKNLFGTTTFQRLKNMDRFISRHRSVQNSDYLLSELMRGWDEYSDNRKRLLDVSRWKAANLITKKDGRAPSLRKPKITLTLNVTGPGNLRLSWGPRPGFEKGFHLLWL